jgi:hypothetical protein
VLSVHALIVTRLASPGQRRCAVSSCLALVSNTSIASQTQVIAAIPYTYTAGPPAS